MVMEIKGTEYEVHFGIKFIRELDKKYEVERENMKFGAGLEMICISAPARRRNVRIRKAWMNTWKTMRISRSCLRRFWKS